MPRVLNHMTVVRDGMHNAFTTMVHWQGAYWIAYRKGERHMYPPGQISVSMSGDRTRWREVARLKVAGDNRDPLFVAMSGDRLALLFPNAPNCERTGEADPIIEQWIAFSNDGFNWESPRRILEPRHHLFHVRRHNGLYYGLDCYREEKLRRLELWTSPDLLKWTRLCQVGSDEAALNESDIIFRPDGEAWIVSRTGGKSTLALFSSAKPPYTDWRVECLGVRIQAPCILEHEGRVYVAGRSVPRLLGETTWAFGQSLYVWELSRGRVTPVLRIPTGGDSTYPGFIKDPEGRLCISYYSQHAYCFGVLPPFDAEVADLPQNATVADIYFAELELP